MSVTFHSTVLLDGAWRVAHKEDDHPCFNLSNANAADFIDWLGLERHGQLMGEWDADQVIGACRIALELAPQDPGVPQMQVRNMIYCGREPGYLQERARWLLELAEFCKSHGTMVGFA